LNKGFILAYVNSSPLRKLKKNDEMLQSLEGSKVHEEIIINCLKLVILCVFVPLWQDDNFQSGFK